MKSDIMNLILCLDLGKLDGSAFLEGLLGSDRDADGLKTILAAYRDFLVVEDCVDKCLGLCDESVVVALKEEVGGLCGLDGLGSADESFVLEVVVVLDSALLAEDFDSLVIAVRGLAAVVDDADRAVLELQGDDRGVDIVILGIAGIGQDCACRGNFRDIAAGQVADHIEVVDHHVSEDTAGNCYIGHGRACGIAGADFDDIGLAQLAGSDYIADCLVASVETADKTDLQLDTSLGNLCQSLVDLGNFCVDGLLAEDVFACPCGTNHELSVFIGGGADKDCIHVSCGKDILGILGAAGDADALCPLFHLLIHERICHDHDLCIRNKVLDICAVQVTDTSCAKKADSKFLAHVFLLKNYYFKAFFKKSIIQNILSNQHSKELFESIIEFRHFFIIHIKVINHLAGAQ